MEILRKDTVSASPETMWKLCLSVKFPHQEIRWSYGILCIENCKIGDIEFLIFWINIYSFDETMQKLCLSTKFPHHEIRWNYGILRSNMYSNFSEPGQLSISSSTKSSNNNEPSFDYLTNISFLANIEENIDEFINVSSLCAVLS